MQATICKNEVPVRHSSRPDVGREFLTISCPNGWDDVKKLTNKVLEHNGSRYTFTGWCSDKNECFFARPINGSADVARIKTHMKLQYGMELKDVESGEIKTVVQYWQDDIAATSYKVRLAYMDSVGLRQDPYYSCDLVSLIEDGTFEVIKN